MTENFVGYRLFINYSLILGKINDYSTDYPSITHYILIDFIDAIDVTD